MNRYIFLTLTLFVITPYLSGQDLAGSWSGEIENQNEKGKKKYTEPIRMFLLKEKFVPDSGWIYIGYFHTLLRDGSRVNYSTIIRGLSNPRTNLFEYKFITYNSTSGDPLWRYGQHSGFTLDNAFNQMKFSHKNQYYPTGYSMDFLTLSKISADIPDSLRKELLARTQKTIAFKNRHYQSLDAANTKVDYVQIEQKGKLTIQMKNTAELPMSFQYDVSSRTKNGRFSNTGTNFLHPKWGSLVSNYSDTVVLAPLEQKELVISLMPGNRIPEDSMAVVINARDLRTNLIYKDTSYIKTAGKERRLPVIVLKPYNTKTYRYEVLGHFYGYTKGSLAEGKRKLDSLIENGNDKKASMWKAYFIDYGMWGYERNEILAKSLSHGLNTYLTPDALLGDPEALFLLVKQENHWARTYDEREQLGAYERILDTSIIVPRLYEATLLNDRTIGNDELRNFRLSATDKLNAGKKLLSQLRTVSYKGYRRADLTIADLFMKGEYLIQNFDSAAYYSSQFVAEKDPQAYALMAKIFLNPASGMYNEAKGLDFATKAANGGWAEALAILGDYSLFSAKANSAEYKKGIGYLQQAADKGHRKSAFKLGLIGLQDASVNRDNNKYYWFEKIAKKGDGNVMLYLASLYEADGVGTINQLKARVWLEQAKRRSYYPERQKKASRDFGLEIMMDLFSDFNASGYTTTRRLSANGLGYEEVHTPSFNGGAGTILSKGLELFLTRQLGAVREQNKPVDQIIALDENADYAVYAGVLKCAIQTGIFCKKGQVVTFRADGYLKYKSINFTFKPDGSDRPIASRKIAPFNSGAILLKTGNGNWSLIGAGWKGHYTVPEDGQLVISINDSDCSDVDLNTGAGDMGFDFELQIFKAMR